MLRDRGPFRSSLVSELILRVCVCLRVLFMVHQVGPGRYSVTTGFEKRKEQGNEGGKTSKGLLLCELW